MAYSSIAGAGTGSVVPGASLALPPTGVSGPTGPVAPPTVTGPITTGSSGATGPAAPQVTPPSPTGLPDTSFLGLLNNLNTGFQQNNGIVDQKNAVLAALLGNPIDPAKMSTLPPDIQSVIQGGNRDALLLQAKILDDSLQGKNNTIASSIGYLTSGYKDAQARADAQRQQHIANIQNFVTQYGSQAPAALKALYGQTYIDQLKAEGIDIDAFAKLSPATIGEQRYSAQYGFTPGATTFSGLDVSMNPGTIGDKTNNLTGMKYSDLSASLGATDSGIAAPDGGTWASFTTPQDSLAASVALLKSPVYAGLTVDQALRKWSGAGGPMGDKSYGSSVTDFPGSTKISSMNDTQLQQLVEDIANNGEAIGKVSASPSMIQNIAQGIETGNQPPVLTGLYGKSPLVKAQLQKDGFNLTKATQDWTAVTKWQNTVDSATFQRAIVAADSAKVYLQNLRQLSAQWDETNPLTPLDYVHFQTALNGGLGLDSQAIAQKVSTQIADLQADMASVYRYGLSSTDSSMENASKTLSENWNNGRLTASLDVIEPNLQVRINSLKNPGNALSVAGGTNPYVGTSTPPGVGTGGTFDDYLKAIGQ